MLYIYYYHHVSFYYAGIGTKLSAELGECYSHVSSLGDFKALTIKLVLYSGTV